MWPWMNTGLMLCLWLKGLSFLGLSVLICTLTVALLCCELFMSVDLVHCAGRTQRSGGNPSSRVSWQSWNWNPESRLVTLSGP